MTNEKEKGAFVLQKKTIQLLKTLKNAYETCYGKPLTNDEFIRLVVASVEEGDVAVWEAYCEMNQ